MSRSPSIITASGQPIQLDRQIGAGGEGTVFSIAARPDLVAKLYNKAPTQQTADKLAVMLRIGTPGLLSLAAWPIDLVFQAGSRNLAGFLMPKVSDCQPIQHLYNPIQRLKCFPRAGWHFQVRAAANLSAAFDEVHKINCLVGDVNQSNVQVSAQATVKLIDCDSFQVRLNGSAFLCEVGVPHYIPPELQGKSLRGVMRTENHDRFGLAVLIYQLLFVGRHPYAGIYSGQGDPSFEELIAGFRFAQGPAAKSWGMAPPPFTPTFADIPSELGALFRRAFKRGSEIGARPRASEWLPVLRNLEASMVECSADPGHKYWRGTGTCVWCRLAGNGGPEYFFGVSATGGGFVVDEAKLVGVLKRLNACRRAEFPYDRSRLITARKPIGDPLPDGITEHRATTKILGIAAAISVFIAPLGIVHRAFLIISLLSTTLLLAWIGIHAYLSPWQREYRRRRSMSGSALVNLEEREGNWWAIVEEYHERHAALCERVRANVASIRGLAENYHRELQKLTANAEQAARLRHLRLNLIADAEIPRIGEGRKQLLASYGIYSAADIEYGKVRNVKGFGDALTAQVLGWRDEVQRQFRFDIATAISPNEQRSLTAQFAQQQQHRLVETGNQLSHLEAAAPMTLASLKRLAPSLRLAVAQYEKATANLMMMRENA